MASSRQGAAGAARDEDAEAFPTFDESDTTEYSSQQSIELKDHNPPTTAPSTSYQVSQPPPAHTRTSQEQQHGRTIPRRPASGNVNIPPNIVISPSADTTRASGPALSSVASVSQYSRRSNGLQKVESPQSYSALRAGSLRHNGGERTRNRGGSNRNPPFRPAEDATSTDIAPSNTDATRGRLREASSPTIGDDENAPTVPGAFDPAVNLGVGGISRRRTLSNAARSMVNRYRTEPSPAPAVPPSYAYNPQVVDLLDVVDPEVSTLTTLTNVQNSLFVPDLGRWLNRRPTYQLSRAPTTISEQSTQSSLQTDQELSQTISRYTSNRPRLENDVSMRRQPTLSLSRTKTTMPHAQLGRSASITSTMTDSHYAVLPHGEKLEGWTEEDKATLDDHVRHMLHSRRSKFKNSMKAFGKYIKKPLGFLVTLYAVLITLFGAAWVIFLIGWISLGSRRDYIINVIDNVLVALFAVMGDGLAPFRAVDTYHMIFIARYHNLTRKLRRARELPKLHDLNDLPQKLNKDEEDPENNLPRDYVPANGEYSVLTQIQQKKLAHHQQKFAKSHSFYKPHETMTHYAFPHRLLVTIVLLLDLHSCLQIALGTCTWAISYKERPFALTTVILACSITVNITAGILISVGDRKTRKKEIIEQMKRQKMTHHAMKRVQEHKRKRDQERAEGEAQPRQNGEPS